MLLCSRDFPTGGISPPDSQRRATTLAAFGTEEIFTRLSMKHSLRVIARI